MSWLPTDDRRCNTTFSPKGPLGGIQVTHHGAGCVCFSEKDSGLSPNIEISGTIASEEEGSFRNRDYDFIGRNQRNVSVSPPSYGTSFPAIKLDPKAIIPKKANRFDAGFDLYALHNGCIAPKMRLAISTGIAVMIPQGWYGRIAPRSGLAHNFGIDVLAGVVDSTYRGEIKVILINHGTGDYTFEAGDRIAQLVLENCGVWEIQEVEAFQAPTTTRGEGGFGSTGK